MEKSTKNILLIIGLGAAAFGVVFLINKKIKKDLKSEDNKLPSSDVKHSRKITFSRKWI